MSNRNDCVVTKTSYSRLVRAEVTANNQLSGLHTEALTTFNALILNAVCIPTDTFAIVHLTNVHFVNGSLLTVCCDFLILMLSLVPLFVLFTFFSFYFYRFSLCCFIGTTERSLSLSGNLNKYNMLMIENDGHSMVLLNMHLCIMNNINPCSKVLSSIKVWIFRSILNEECTAA